MSHQRKVSVFFSPHTNASFIVDTLSCHHKLMTLVSWGDFPLARSQDVSCRYLVMTRPVWGFLLLLQYKLWSVCSTYWLIYWALGQERQKIYCSWPITFSLILAWKYTNGVILFFASMCLFCMCICMQEKKTEVMIPHPYILWLRFDGHFISPSPLSLVVPHSPASSLHTAF